MKKLFTILTLGLSLTFLAARDIKGNDYFVSGNLGFQNTKANLQSDKLKDLSKYRERY